MPICCFCGINKQDDPDGLCEKCKKFIWKKMENGEVIEFPKYMDEKVAIYIKKIEKQLKK